MSNWGQGGGVLGADSLNPISSVIQFCCSSRLAVVQSHVQRMTQLVWCTSPPCFSSPPEVSQGLALAQLLMESFLFAGRVESVGQCTLCFTNRNLLCVVMWGDGCHLDFYLLVLHFAFVEYAYIIKIELFCLREFPLKQGCKDSISISVPLGRTTLMLLGLRKTPPLK